MTDSAPEPDLPAFLGGVPIRRDGPPLWPTEDAEVQAVLRNLAISGDWGRYHGEHCPTLIEKLCGLHSVLFAILTSSGTSAVELALRGAKIQAGDEVLMSAYDFKANFTNIALLGAVPVLIDIDPRSGQLDVSQLPQAVSPKTKAILASHLHGGVVDMESLMEFAISRHLTVIEDACQMPLADVQGRPAGTWGDVGVISFGGSKLLTAGRGGAIVSHHEEIAQRIHLYTQRGNDAYPLSEMQAAVLLPQLNSLPTRRLVRTETAHLIRKAVATSACLKLFPMEAPGSELDFYKLGMWYDPAGLEGLSRSQFCAAMRAEGIPIDPGFRALHLIHAKKRFRGVGTLSNAQRADESLVVLHHPLLLAGKTGADQFVRALDRVQRHATILKSQVPE